MTKAPVIIHNDELKEYIKQDYSVADIDHIHDILLQNDSLNFPTVENRGLFKAALTIATNDSQQEDQESTGYDNVWIRDNIHVSFAHYIQQKYDIVSSNLDDIVAFWMKYKNRWYNCISGIVDYNQHIMERPHIRFNGTLLQENEQQWSHAQNDAM